jgi:hypothetical protein
LDVPPVTAKTESSGFLDGIKIPSPLLYHRRSRELLTRSSDSDINAELAKTFLLDCGQNPPEPDFESYKVFDDAVDAPITITAPDPTTTVELQTSNTGLGERFPFYNIPWAPWIVPSAPTASLVTPPIVNAVQGTSVRGSLSESTATVIAQRRLLSSGHESSLEGLNSAETSPRTQLAPSVESDQLKSPTDFIDDDPFTVFKRWTAFEEAIRKPCQSETTVARNSASRLLSGTMAPAAREGVAAPCPTSAIAAPTCLALVPARLYQHQYLSWPRQLLYEPEYKKNVDVDSQSPVLQSFDTNHWLQAKGHTSPSPFYNSRRRADHSASEESVSSFDEDFKIPIEEDIVTKTKLEPFLEPNEILGEEDEGYVTARENEAEVVYEEVLGSGSESWEDWTWSDDDLQEH